MSNTRKPKLFEPKRTEIKTAIDIATPVSKPMFTIDPRGPVMKVKPPSTRKHEPLNTRAGAKGFGLYRMTKSRSLTGPAAHMVRTKPHDDKSK